MCTEHDCGHGQAAADIPLYRAAEDGLVTLGPDVTELMTALDDHIRSWARRVPARPMIYPPLMRAADLDTLDFFHNFPHLGVMTAGIAEPHQAAVAEEAKAGPVGVIAGDRLTDATHLLPTAACYNIYLDLRGSRLDGPRFTTTIGRCFRRETHYDGLRRLMGFSMREIVCVGPQDAVKAHLKTFRSKIRAFADRLDLPLEIEAATDPFFSADAARTAMQKLFPVKEEFVYGGSLAIASVNFHRNFFGERCDIRTADGEHAFSGCVAFGLERWMHALLDQHGGDARRARAALEVAIADEAAEDAALGLDAGSMVSPPSADVAQAPRKRTPAGAEA
ncbi:hypothetical protein P7L70_01510 (plasmid) [Tistrella mobilis]|uniref:aminoacyl--tRNA ligase-related protein n=1 Tax=Tistrella mobilis TaxID=171437 RepID=UPI003558D5A0